jgi:hypothetical protein
LYEVEEIVGDGEAGGWEVVRGEEGDEEVDYGSIVGV